MIKYFNLTDRCFKSFIFLKSSVACGLKTLVYIFCKTVSWLNSLLFFKLVFVSV